MTVRPPDLANAARARIQAGISREQALILGYADLTSQPLDPWLPDEAAILLRAERLLIDGVHIADALDTARREAATFASEDTP